MREGQLSTRDLAADDVEEVVGSEPDAHEPDPRQQGRPLPNFERLSSRARKAAQPAARPNDGHDTSLFPRLVLACINSDFHNQICMFQHFRDLQNNLAEFSFFCECSMTCFIVPPLRTPLHSKIVSPSQTDSED